MKTMVNSNWPVKIEQTHWPSPQHSPPRADTPKHAQEGYRREEGYMLKRDTCMWAHADPVHTGRRLSEASPHLRGLKPKGANEQPDQGKQGRG